MSASKLQLKYWESLKGKTPWNKGKKETRQEVLQKQSNSHKGKTTWNKGLTKEDPRVQKYMHKKGEFKQSEAAKEKLRKIHKGKHHSPRTEFKKGQIDARNCNKIWDINNGVTLCQECHNLTKKRGYISND